MNGVNIRAETPSNAPFPLGAEDLKILGGDLVSDLHLLYDYLEPYEEWALAGDLTTVELLQTLKEDGFFKDLRVLEVMVDKLIASLKAIIQKVKSLYGAHAEKKKDQALQAAVGSLWKLRTSGRPLLSELVWLMADASQMMHFTDAATQAQKNRRPEDSLAAGQEWKVKRRVEKDTNAPRLMNFCNGMIFLAESNRHTFLRRQAREDTSTEAVFKKHRWATLRSLTPGKALRYIIHGQDAENLGLQIIVVPIVDQKHGVFESLHIDFSFNSTAQDPNLQTFTKIMPLHFTVALSRVHPELTLPGNGYISVKPLFEAYDLGGFYENLKAYVWTLVEKGVEDGNLLSVETEAAPAVLETPMEPVREQVQAEVAEQVPLPTSTAKPKARAKKGLRRTTRNIETADVLSTLGLLGIRNQPGGSHFILKGPNLQTGEEQTLAIPFNASANQNGKNSAPYIAQAARVFGFTREDFLEKLAEI